MKKILFSLIIFGVASCSMFAPYKPPSSEPVAVVTFAAPNLEGEFLASTSLDFVINHFDSRCKVIHLGKVGLKPGKLDETYNVAANERLYIQMSYDRSSIFYSRRGSISFSIIPQPGKQYVFQFMTFFGHMESNVFEKQATGELIKIQTDRYASCQKT